VRELEEAEWDSVLQVPSKERRDDALGGAYLARPPSKGGH